MGCIKIVGLTADDHAAKKGNVDVRIVIAELSSKSAARSPVHKASSSAFGAPAANVSSKQLPYHVLQYSLFVLQ